MVSTDDDAMPRIAGSGDCGNSPKNKFVQDAAIEIESGRIVPAHFSENVIWERSTEPPVRGRQALIPALATRTKPVAITVDHAISHGKTGAASGEVTLPNGEKRRFSHVFEFTNAKAVCVAVIKSYA